MIQPYFIRHVFVGDLDNVKKIKPEIDEETILKRIELQTQDKAEFLILETAGQAVAFVFVKWFGKPTHPDYPDIEDLYTKLEERSKGYGNLLIRECESIAKFRGFNKIGLAVNPEKNENAYKLYVECGYKNTNEPKYLDGIYNGIEDWVIDMEKNLS